MAFLSPWIIGFCTFTLIPLAMSFYYSLCDYPLLRGPMYTGLRNYRMLWNDPEFWLVLRNTFFYAGLSLPLGMVIALSAAALLNVKVRGMSVYRTIIFLPSLVPAVASAMLWLWLLNAKLGLINIFLRNIGIDDPPDWLTSAAWVKPALVMMSLWSVGNTVVIYLAGLQDVPRELYEAAELDGAGVAQQLRHVTLPMISPVIFFNLVIGIIGSLQYFGPAYIMVPNGGTDKSAYFYSVALFDQAFQSLRMGYASAMAWVQLVIVLTLTALAFWTSKRWVHQQGK
jgi:multiple sugar transport system permease protein